MSTSGNAGFAVTSQFFDQAADALAQLQKTLMIEIVVGDVITGVAKLFNGELGRRPPKFPKEYSRMFLSNVPYVSKSLLYCLRDSIHDQLCLVTTLMGR